MSKLSVADELAFENLPDEVKEIAKKYYEGKMKDLEDEVEKAKDNNDGSYDDGYGEGYLEGCLVDCENCEALEEQIEELQEQIQSMKEMNGDD